MIGRLVDSLFFLDGSFVGSFVCLHLLSCLVSWLVDLLLACWFVDRLDRTLVGQLVSTLASSLLCLFAERVGWLLC